MAHYKILSAKVYIGDGPIETADGVVGVGGTYELSDNTVAILEGFLNLEKVDDLATGGEIEKDIPIAVSGESGPESYPGPRGREKVTPVEFSDDK